MRVPRDPFAQKRTKTYHYADSCIVPRAVPLEDGTLTLDLREKYELSADDIDGVWITLRIPNTKADQSAFAEIAQQAFTSVRNAGEQSFVRIIEAWWLQEPMDGTTYNRLGRWASEWIDSCVSDAWQEGNEAVEKKGVTPSSPKTTRSSSAKEVDPAPAS